MFDGLLFLLMGVALSAAAAWMRMDFDDLAHDIWRYYNSIPETPWGPRWLRWQFRPTKRQGRQLTWALIVLSVAMSVWFVTQGMVILVQAG